MLIQSLKYDNKEQEYIMETLQLISKPWQSKTHQQSVLRDDISAGSRRSAPESRVSKRRARVPATRHGEGRSLILATIDLIEDVA
jgi:hypothetical protein